MNARESSRPVSVVGAWSGPFDAGASRWLLIPGCKTNNHIQALLAVVLFILDTLFLHERQRAPGRGRLVQALGRAGRGPPGVWGGPQATERKLKNTAGGFGEAGWQWGADIFIYAKTPDVFFFFFFLSLELRPPSTSGPEPPVCIPAAAQSRKGVGRLGSPK